MQYLVERAKDTEYGRKHLFATIKSYEDFTQNIPVNTYEELKGDIDRMRHGERNILWPGQVRWYAKSSGTTNDKSKFIPVSHEGLQTIHYQGGKDVIAYYLSNHPESRLFNGKSLILGGSHSPNYNLYNSLVGDLSAILIENINPLANLCRVPKKSTALLSDFEVKRDRIAQETLKQNVTNLSGVPSWMLSVIVRVLELSGKQHLEEVWPNLEVFFHGGIAFTPYREQYEQLITKQGMNYMETYNASEGFFGIQDDPTDSSMSLMLDYGVFYEFLPMDEFESEHQNIVPLSGEEIGRNYARLISTACGLWRYEIGDTVQSLRPILISLLSPEEPSISSMPLVKNLSWTMPRRVSKPLARPLAHSYLTTQQPQCIWMRRLNVVISGSLSLRKNPLHLTSLPKFLMTNYKRLTQTTRRNVFITLPFNHLR